ncbi:MULTISPECIES: phenylacetic acid degradation bifunctional protein PaaZ [unclassified Beijerinckia]|uniref:phenylacetic acid degradation bifunctional protein PaaZ n=1 Tax=unclassified Beijerinckia TaxID=2638183 RepID=UPI000899A895|nr:MULTISPECIES: phenylacetic acid degradation bifunctional protein PaaZ [unclassified Beijerinckia]MDH7798638.1 oxepin-CoA hydrolase/3-oxo-5,6-dehydrosuberyl-CoA semialdehyde dehydrogenase [Beijerinckia sp. GAS462]SED27568.1 oxepin-CoA hydrolase / 3-oxo-5,6-dehydrosuberyl-CoA semialdehyde dehydrogenase [Beijerinckia sp. 28-YEA-48]
MIELSSHVLGRWLPPSTEGADIRSAVTGEAVARVASGPVATADVLAYARKVGRPALRKTTFRDRAETLKKLAEYLNAHKEQLYDLSRHAGATKMDAMLDVDGGIGVLFVYASKGRRELPASNLLLDGDIEPLTKSGNFIGRHVRTPLQGVAVHINAFNFPCWGLLEKFAPAFLAGVPVITKPATVTAYVAERLVRLMEASGLLPAGALQMIIGSTGDLFDHLTGQDVVAFTGSAETAQLLQRQPVIAREAVRFIAERDSVNAALLAPDGLPGTPEFDLFIKEVAREMTVKAGQKCTAIRRAFVPRSALPAAIEALRARLAKVTIGDPALETVRMGPLVGLSQRGQVLDLVGKLRGECELAFGDPQAFDVVGANAQTGAFLPPLLLTCASPASANHVHHVEAFGPVATLLPYDDLDQALDLVNRGEGSLVASVYTYDAAAAARIVQDIGSFHGRLLFIDRDCGAEQTGHGSPMPHLVHGGPGRAGGGEELGGLRGMMHYMQRTALQGSVTRISSAIDG